MANTFRQWACCITYYRDYYYLGEALIDGELATCLLDNGAQLNFITPAYAHRWGMDIMSLESLAQEVGGKHSSNSRHRGYHGESRRICYNECSDTLC